MLKVLKYGSTLWVTTFLFCLLIEDSLNYIVAMKLIVWMDYVTKSQWFFFIIEKSNVICLTESTWYQFESKVNAVSSSLFDWKIPSWIENKKWLNSKWWHFSIEIGDQMNSCIFHSVLLFCDRLILWELNWNVFIWMKHNRK